MCLCDNVQSKRFFMCSQLALLTFGLLQLPMRLYPQFHPDLMDGVRGFLIAVAVGMMILAARTSRRDAA